MPADKMTDLKTVQALVSAVELAENYSDHPEYERTMTNALTLGRALLAQMQRDAVQPGWKLVPLEPNNKMIDAAILNSNEWARGTTDFAGTYRAMLDAAPQPAPEPQQGPLTDDDWQAIADACDCIVPGRLKEAINKRLMERLR